MPVTGGGARSWVPMLLLTVAFGLFPALARAQAAPGGDAPPLTFEAWGVAQGLPGPSVRDFAQTPDGQIWVATDKGVARFDGRQLVPLAEQAGFERARETVTLAADAHGSLWMAPAQGEPICLRPGKGLQDCLPEGHQITAKVRIVDMDADGSGRVWLATDDLVYLFADGQLSWLTSVPTDSIGVVRGLHLDGEGRLWIAGSRGLFLRGSNSGDVQAYAIPGESAPDILALAGGPGGTVWASGAGFLFRVAKDGDRVLRAADGLPRAAITGIVEDREGAVWLASSEGLFRWQPGQERPWRHITQASGGLPANDLAALFADKDGALWIGTRAAGIARLTPARTSLPADAPDAPPASRRWLFALAALVLLLAAVTTVARARRRRSPVVEPRA